MSESERDIRVKEVGDRVEEAVKAALAVLEKEGMSARDADEFVRECVFNAWMDWDYGAPVEGFSAVREP